MTVRPPKLGEGWWQVSDIDDNVCAECGQTGLMELTKPSIYVNEWIPATQSNIFLLAFCDMLCLARFVHRLPAPGKRST